MDSDFRLMKETVETANEYIDRLVEGADAISGYIQGGREDKGLMISADLIDGLNWLMDVLNLTRLLQERCGEVIGTEQCSKLFSVLIEAFENRDYVLLSDVLEYELIPALKDWQGRFQEILSKTGDVE